MKKKLFAVLMVMMMTLTACGGPGGGSDPLSAARANMDAVTSLDGTMVMELDMEVAGEVMESVTTMNMTVFNDPMRLKMDMKMELGLMGEAVTVPYMEVYAEEDGAGGYKLYMQQDGAGPAGHPGGAGGVRFQRRNGRLYGQRLLLHPGGYRERGRRRGL